MKALLRPGFWLPAGLVLIAGIWPFASGREATREVVFTVLMSVALASSLNLLLGYTGYVSFGHIVFFGLGAYVGFYLMSARGTPLYLAALAGGLSSGALAFLLGKAILRLRGAYFAWPPSASTRPPGPSSATTSLSAARSGCG